MGDNVYSNPMGVISPSFTVESADLPAGTIVEMTGDDQVDKPAADSEKVVGRLVKATTAVNQLRAVDTRFSSIDKVLLSETVVAGDHAKITADVGGAQTVGKWLKASDAVACDIGMFLQGGDSTDEVDMGSW